MSPIRLPNLPTPSSILKSITTKDASSIQPVSRTLTLPQFADALKILDTLWENNKSVHNDAYKVGKSYYGIEPDAAYTEFLSALLTLFFNSIKEQITKTSPNIDEQQAKLLHINAIQKAFLANLAILKNFDLPIDKTQLIAVFNGYSITQAAGILKK